MRNSTILTCLFLLILLVISTGQTDEKINPEVADTLHQVEDSLQAANNHDHHEEEGSDHHHDMPNLSDDEMTLLYQENTEEAFHVLEGGHSQSEINDYYEKTGMYAFDMVPDHWFDPANKSDLKSQSIFLLIGILCVSMVLKLWKVGG